MIEYFDTVEKQNKLIKIAKSWIGTPFHHMWHAKGRGTDCSLFIAEIFKEIKLIDDFKVDYYPTDWHLNGKHILENTIKTTKLRDRYKLVEVKDLKIGDIMLFTFVKSGIPHHSALYLGNNEIIQAGNNGVALIDYDYRWKRHLVSIYRVVK